MPERLSLIAGSGALVPEVIEAARSRGYELQVLSLEGKRNLCGLRAVPFDIGDPKLALDAIESFGATVATMAGGVRFTDRTREGLLRVLDGGGHSIGDSLLSALAVRLTQLTGARMVGVHEIAPALIAPEGRIAGPEPTEVLHEAAAFALDLVRQAGSIDLGQGIVVSGRRAVALEDIAGTDALLKRVRVYRRHGLAADGRSPLVFAKAAKLGQPLFVDLPAIGPRTITNARKAGIALIAVQAGATLLIQREALIAAANAARLPVVGMAVADG